MHECVHERAGAALQQRVSGGQITEAFVNDILMPHRTE